MSIASTGKQLITDTLQGIGAGTTATVSLAYPIAKAAYGLLTIGGKATLQQRLDKFDNFIPVSEGVAQKVDAAWNYVVTHPKSTAMGRGPSATLLLAGLPIGLLGVPLTFVAGAHAGQQNGAE
jgi:hypothetical protein